MKHDRLKILTATALMTSITCYGADHTRVEGFEMTATTDKHETLTVEKAPLLTSSYSIYHNLGWEKDYLYLTYSSSPNGAIDSSTTVEIEGGTTHTFGIRSNDSEDRNYRRKTILNGTDVKELILETDKTGKHENVDAVQLRGAVTGSIKSKGNYIIENETTSLINGTITQTSDGVLSIINKGTIVNNSIEEGAGEINITNENGGKITSKVIRGTSVKNRGQIKTQFADLRELNNSETGEFVIDDASRPGMLVSERITNYGNLVARNTAIIQASSIDNAGSITSDGRIDMIITRNDPKLTNHSGGTIVLTGEGVRMSGTKWEIVNDGTLDGDVRVESQLHQKTGEITNKGVWSATFIDNDDRWKSSYNTIHNLGGVIQTKRDGGTLEVTNFLNGGTLDIRKGGLTINGNYRAVDNATLISGGELRGDETKLPTLTINGTVSGSTAVEVENLGGEGGETVDGITVARAKEVVGQGFQQKEGTRIVAGAYDYNLVRMDGGEYTEWRLSSTVDPGPIPPGPIPPGPIPPGPIPPGPTPEPLHKFRPEAQAYTENLRQANTLFMTDSEQRRAVGEYADPVTGRTETSSLWLSQTGGHSTRHDASGQLKSDYNRYVMQLGGTVLSLQAGDDGRLETGVQAGYGHARGDSRSALTGYRARGTVSGYGTGIYGTWRQHREGQSGAYVSTTLQYSWLKNQVKGDDLAAEKYDARGTTLSLEGGYDLAVWQGGAQNGDSLFIRPRAQVTRMGVKADEHREANGTRVSQQGDGNVFSRTGVRVWLDKAVTKTQRVQPFVEANWLHNTRDFCSSMNGVRDCQAGNRDQAEVLAGVTGDVSRNVAVTAQAGGQFGSQASRDLAGTLNVSVKF